MAMKRGGGERTNKRHILPRRGFPIKGVMQQKYPEGMRVPDGTRTKNRPHWPAEGQ